MFLCVASGKYELVVKHSRFIAISAVVDSRDSAREFVYGVRREYADATHVCSGFISDESGDEFGYDDDGEPSGTAGKPIYSALVSAGARRSCIAVVRYFGGVKLGTGGLTRAYRDVAAGLIESAGLVEAERYAVYDAECDAETFKRVRSALRNTPFRVDKIVYAAAVGFTVSAPTTEDVSATLTALGVPADGILKTDESYMFTEMNK